MDDEPLFNSGGFWESRTPEQLKELIEGNFPSSAIYENALAERKRREDRAALEAEQRHRGRDRRIAFWGMVAAVIAAVASVVGIFVRGH